MFMQHIRNRCSMQVDEKLPVPKDFEYKILGTLIQDLEENMEAAGYGDELKTTLRADFTTARKVVRSRGSVNAAKLSASLYTQSMLFGRKCHCAGDAQAFFTQYQLGALLKKYPFQGIDTSTPARESFFKAEDECARFNSENYLALYRLDSTCHVLYGNMIEEIQNDIQSLLGAEPDLARVEVGAKHGPGMAVGPQYKKGRSTSYYKWSELPYSVTPSAEPYSREAIEHDPRWLGALDDWYRSRTDNRYGPINLDHFWSKVFMPVTGSRITGVPKTALTDRTIAIEPAMNVYLQLGVDRVMRHRLKKRWGYDLDTQEVNQSLAKEGAENGNYSTIDLSAASDTISLRICEMLLPPAWYSLLLDLRSPIGEFAGKTVTFEKISSMGNGFTFALETILFAAVVRHVGRRLGYQSVKSAVYGDDIIIHRDMAPSVIDVLQLCGFSINIDKSFVDGPFRESCGSDWFLGHDVRPVFLTRKLSNVMDLFYLHNALYLLERKLCWYWEMHFDRTRKLIRKYIPKKYSYLYGPPSENLDAYLFSSRSIPGVGCHRWHYKISVVPKKFNRKSSFLFRKLMSSLKDGSSYENRWDRKKQLTTGNSFDIVRRECVTYKCAKRMVYEYRP